MNTIPETIPAIIPWMVRGRGVNVDDFGIIMGFLDFRDPRPAHEQFDAKYGYGGGWNPVPKFTMGVDGSLSYPGDPVLHWLLKGVLRDETIYIYPHSWVAIVQPDGNFEVSRMD